MSLLPCPMIVLLSVGLRQSPAPTPTRLLFETTTSVVRVDVVATDRRKKTVSDLRPEEFEIVFDGKRFAPSLAQFISIAGANPPIEGATLQSRTMAFVTAFPILEGTRGGSNRESSMFSLQRAKATLDAVIASRNPADGVAVVQADDDIPMIRFTRDPEKLRLEVLRLGTAWVDRAAGGRHKITIVNSDDRGGVLAYSTRLVELVEHVVRALADQGGRRMLFLLTDFFPTGRSNGAADKDLIDRTRTLADLANRYQVTVFGLSPGGGFSDGLDFLARRTGGQTVQFTSRLKESLLEILAANEGYYLLGFEPTSAGLRFPQPIAVRALRKGVRVRARQEVFTDGIREIPKDR